ncbi:hypothetical protein L6452_37522 [Arctium lappa]|uniref:Uncharacterized protein n=1 Tax=Arctium lappa TaxID=4217 RepID=A0ACB8Y3X7_ARCLA|nr:hypothetical protein L6452_37522 [Arctium lappa]
MRENTEKEKSMSFSPFFITQIHILLPFSSNHKDPRQFFQTLSTSINIIIKLAFYNPSSFSLSSITK